MLVSGMVFPGFLGSQSFPKRLGPLKPSGYTPKIVEDFDRDALASKCGGSRSVPKVGGWGWEHPGGHGRLDVVGIGWFWAIYNDLSRGHPKWWFSKGIPPKWP